LVPIEINQEKLMQQREVAADTDLGESLVRRAREMVPIIAKRAARTEQERCIPAETIAELREAGFFRILQPKRYGGYELDPRVFYEVQMTLAEGCMSTGWVYGVVAVHNWQMGLFDVRAQEDVWGKDTSVLVSSTYMPKGQVKRVEGGFRFNGQWGFSSGVDHAKWIFLGGIVPSEDGRGMPDYRTFLLPRSDFQVIDDWHVMGLKGTGSKGIVVNDVFVPEYRTHRGSDAFNNSSPGLEVNRAPLYRLPFAQIFVRAVSSASIGALQGALNAFREYASKRVSSNDLSRTAEDPAAELAAADAALAIDEMKLALFRTFESLMDKARSGEPLDMQERIHYRYQSAYVAERCAQQVDRLLHACVGQGIYLDNPVQRFFVDIHAARVHYANNPDKFGRNYGGVLLGLGSTDFFI
jgi:3-hydroxy-9,10-secoandrosta-1,3,5(10)-triene-9,17-dione monooxygenase